MTTGKQQNLQSRWQQIEKNGKVQNIIQTVLYTGISRTILVKKKYFCKIGMYFEIAAIYIFNHEHLMIFIVSNWTFQMPF